MEKREALEICLKVWDYIGLNGGSKRAALCALSLDHLAQDCPLCRYVTGLKDWNCSSCPVEWPKINESDSANCVNSYYNTWGSEESVSGGWSKKSKELAFKIANLALNALNKEWPEEEI